MASTNVKPSLIVARIKRILDSPCNIFSLFRKYHAGTFPDHDPDKNLTEKDLLRNMSIPEDSFYPYPNASSFLLGDWYWNGGIKKSLSSFADLMKIVGHPEFQPEDIARTNWSQINRQLDGSWQSLNDDDWVSEPAEGDWKETLIMIKVPFHKRTSCLGLEEFIAGKLWHRSLVSVICKKNSRPSSHQHLHHEPYKLYWQLLADAEPVRVHKELYLSDAFIEAHRQLQDSPGRLGYDLPRVIADIMLVSDATQLTAFSNAKLTPVYLAFGNKSMDQRPKLSCKMYEHVAYFKKVSSLLSSKVHSIKLSSF